MELPGFLKFAETGKAIIAIDFAASSIKLVYLESRQDKFSLLAYSLKEINTDQKTSEELGAEISSMLKEHSITTKKTYLSISHPEQVFIKKVTLPQMPKDELLNAVKWQMKNEFTFSPEESVSDLQTIREYTDSEGSKKIELFCVFVKRELINKYLSAVVACGLEPVKISSSVFNYLGILDSITAKPEISAILDIGYSQSHVAIYNKNKLSFMRSFNFSTEKIFASLIGVLASDSGRVEIDAQRAQQLILQHGIVFDESTNLEGGVKANQIVPLIRPLLETITKEIERSFEYFKYEAGLEKPEVLYLVGGGANLKNLDIYLANQLKIKVIKLPLSDFLDTTNINPEKFSLVANQLVGAIGLGVSASTINLLPPEVKSQKSELIQKSTLRVAAVVVGVMFFLSWLAVNFQIRDFKKRLKIAQVHLSSMEEIKTLKQRVDLKENYISKIYDGRIPPEGILKFIGSIIPPSIILDELAYDHSRHSLNLSGVVRLTGEPIEKVLTEFMNKLEDSKFVSDANLLHSKSDQGVNTFQIECQLVQ